MDCNIAMDAKPKYYPFEKSPRNNPRGYGLEYVVNLPFLIVRGDEMGQSFG
jgi:hypothetical protein